MNEADWVNLKSAFSQFSYASFIVAIAIYLSGFIPRALRWKIMMNRVQPINFYNSGEIIIMGYASNNLLPFRLGEFVRAGMAKKITSASFTGALGSIFAERIIDGATIVLMLMLSARYLLQDISTDIQLLLNFGTILFGGAIVVLFAMALCTDKIRPFILKIPVPKVPELVMKVLEALSFFKSPGQALSVLLISIIIWSVEGFMFGWLLSEIQVENAWIAGFFTMAIVNLGILLPSTPGYLGIFQAATVIAFLALGLPKDEGIAYGFVIHAAQYFPITLLGIVLFLKNGTSLKDLARMKAHS
jgi:uncharacterized protein (TIRG00374 family)